SARQRHRASRPQARERHGRRRRPRQNFGLRSGKGNPRRRSHRRHAHFHGTNGGRRRHGYALLHVPGTNRGPRSRPSHRHFLVGHHSLRNVDGPPSIRGSFF